MDKRALLAIVLCTLVFVLYFQVLSWLYPPIPKSPAQNPQGQATEPKPGPPQTPANGAQKPPETAKAAFAPIPAGVKEHTVETAAFKAVFTSQGGALKELISKKYYKDYKKEQFLPYLAPSHRGENHFVLTVEPSALDLSTAPWEMTVENQTVRFKQKTPEGLEIVKTFTFEADRETFKFGVHVQPLASQTATLRLTAFAGIQHDSPYRAVQYLNAYTGISSAQGPSIQYSNATETKSVPSTDIGWTGIKNRYFTAALVPQGTHLVETYEFSPIPVSGATPDPKLANILCRLSFKKQDFKDQPLYFEATVYAGAIEARKLRELGSGMDLLMDYSGFDFVGSAILWLMNVFHVIFFGNYGIAIIFTTLFVRLLLFPISKKGTVSSFKMQQMQPKLAVLKEKYKGDSQKFAREQMKLFKESGVSPLSGCLPLLIQFPIFIGMYSVFDISVDLRQSHFFLWIQDLSQPDRLAKLPFSVLGNNDLNILPIIMLVTTLWQMLVTPKSPDPNMAVQRVMMIFMMPVMLGLFCYGQASGLSLYFTVNALGGMVEQKLIKKYFLPR